MADEKDPTETEREREHSEAEPKKPRVRRKPAAKKAEPAAADSRCCGGDRRAGRGDTRQGRRKGQARRQGQGQGEGRRRRGARAPKPKRRTPRRAKAEAGKPAAPAAKTRRPSRDYGDNPPMVRAHAKYVRTSARKARLVCDHIRGKSVEEARAILAHASRDVARDWSKLLESAVANAEHNHELIGDELRIAAVKADEGPTLKRFRPRAMGRATKIRKRTCHLSITLTPMDRER